MKCNAFVFSKSSKRNKELSSLPYRPEVTSHIQEIFTGTQFKPPGGKLLTYLRLEAKKRNTQKTKPPKTSPFLFELYNLMEFFSFCVQIYGMSDVESSFQILAITTLFSFFCPEFLAIAYVQICRTKYTFAWHFFGWKYESHNQTSFLGDRKG